LPVLPSPILTFSFILATLYGAAFHVILGGDARRLVLFLLSSWGGFALGQFVGVTFGIDLFAIGALRVVAASAGAILALLAVSFLTSRRMRKRTARSS
jgi:putative flippase GtrA